MSGCKFDRAWIGSCGDEMVNETGFCELHSSMRCTSCGKQATRECDHTGIQFVCGAPLCDSCRHGVPQRGQEGMFALGGGHVSKDEYEKQFQARYGSTKGH